MSKTTLWTGRVLTALTGIFMLTSGINLMFVRSADLREGFAKFGYSPDVMPGIGLAALIGSLLYLFPKTSTLGAILLTAYLGGATATHVRINDPTFVAPVVVGCLIWLGLFLREDRLRALVPITR